MIIIDVNDFDFNDAPVIKETFCNINKHYKEECGKNTIVITLVGDFYETYGLKLALTDNNPMPYTPNLSTHGAARQPPQESKNDGQESKNDGQESKNGEHSGSGSESEHNEHSSSGVGGSFDDNDNDNCMIGSNIVPFSEICDLAISKKSSVFLHIPTGKKYNLYIAGFKHLFVDKYVNKLIAAGYTVIQYDQVVPGVTAAGSSEDASHKLTPGGKPKSIARVHTCTYSPGTVVNENKSSSSITACLWIEKFKTQLGIGMCAIDIYSGKTYIYEYTIYYVHSSTTYDELERFISVNMPSELILISNLPEKEITDIITFIGTTSILVHKIQISDSKKCENCQKQTYQKELLVKFYSLEIYTAFADRFYENTIATQSFCYLLDFISHHNSNLIRNIEYPIFSNQSTKVILANYALKQLNIIDDGTHSGHFSSIQKMLNSCITPMGKRQFNHILVNPTTDIPHLEKEYSMIDHIMMLPSAQHYLITNLLKKIMDLQKFLRQLMCQKITPKHLAQLHQSISATICIYDHLKLDPVMVDYLPNFDYAATVNLQNYLVQTFFLEECKLENGLSNFDKMIIRPHINVEMDTIMGTQVESMDKLIACVSYFNILMNNRDKKKKTGPITEYIKITETGTHIINLCCTAVRSKILGESIAGKEKTTLSYVSSFDQHIHEFEFELNDITFEKKTTTNVSIVSPAINNLCSSAKNIGRELQDKINSVYRSLIGQLEIYFPIINNICQLIVNIDVIYCKALMAIKFNYCRPSIQQSDKSFIEAKGIRHPLIECLQTEEIYVSNDLHLSGSGMLLFGTNGVGKSSFCKSIGIVIIMAQAGLFVPASELIYYPFTHIFTRILGNDNLFKSLSSFMVEMLELRTILGNANNRSLVLGDEIASGTESISARSIVVASLKHLYNLGACFIFATHLHEIIQYPEITSMSDRLHIYHLSIQILNGKVKCGRKLEEGAGPAVYGLLMCSVLDLPATFLEEAENIRAKYFPESLSVLERNVSRYNSSKIMGTCEKCLRQMSTESHHIYKQSNADENGYITTPDHRVFHKNHAKNLMAVCAECHAEYHRTT